MNYDKVKKLLKRIKQKSPKILVLGDVMLDQYISGIVDRISPEAPVPILDYKKIYLEVQVTLQIILLIWVLMLN